jgi:hypothetical protein
VSEGLAGEGPPLMSRPVEHVLLVVEAFYRAWRLRQAPAPLTLAAISRNAAKVGVVLLVDHPRRPLEDSLTCAGRVVLPLLAVAMGRHGCPGVAAVVEAAEVEWALLVAEEITRREKA